MKLCYSCKRFSMLTAEPDYSEFTPGCEWYMGCSALVWEFNPYEDDVNKFRKCLESALECAFFEEVEQ